MNIMQFEYKTLNLLDEVTTIEITIDHENKRIHLFDKDQVVYPTYNFVNKSLEASEEFFKLEQNLRLKYLTQTFFQKNDSIEWVFYSLGKSVVKFENNRIVKIDSIEGNVIFRNYYEKVKE